MKPLFAVALLAFAPPDTAPPDIAPQPRHRSGIGLAPDGTGRSRTEIAMRAEVVELLLFEEHAEVRAVFDMEHTGAAPEELEVGFPTEAHPIERHIRDGLRFVSPFATDGGTIYAFAAEVDGTAIEVERKTVDKDDRRRVHRHWVCWPMRFEPGQKRTVEVRYEVETKDSLYLEPHSALQPRELIYVLETGAGWKDPIGSARVLLKAGAGFDLSRIASATPPPTTKGEAEWEWTFENFEPDFDLSIRYNVYRDAKDAVARIERALAQRPDSLELALDLAENQTALGNHAEAAPRFAQLADHRVAGRHRLPKFVYARLDDRPAAYLAARSYAAAELLERAQPYIEPALEQLGQRISYLERRLQGRFGSKEDAARLETLIARRVELEALRR